MVFESIRKASNQLRFHGQGAASSVAFRSHGAVRSNPTRQVFESSSIVSHYGSPQVLLAQGTCFFVIGNYDQTSVLKIPKKVLYGEYIRDLFRRPVDWRASYRRYVKERDRSRWANRSRDVLLSLHQRDDQFVYTMFGVTRFGSPNVFSIQLNDDVTTTYKSWYYEQEWITGLGGNNAKLDRFDWRQMTGLQKALWARGVGFAVPGETYGPKNWGLRPDGELCVMDVSHLTTDFDTVSAVLDDRIAEWRRQTFLERQKVNSVGTVHAYFDRVRSEINRDVLKKTWRSAAN